MIVYKLTDQRGQTKNNTQWGEHVTHCTDGHGSLCGPGWLHAYEHPLLAVLHNPVHNNFHNPRLWEAHASGEVLRDGQTKLGTTMLTTIREIPLPIVTRAQRVAYAILCASVWADPHGAWWRWATRWMNGQDRSVAVAVAVEASAAESAGAELDLVSAAQWAMTVRE